jgi:hypothetical protein
LLTLTACTVLYIEGDGNHVEGSNTRGDFTPSDRPVQKLLESLHPQAH